MTAVEIYQAEKAAYIARRGIDRVALMQRRKERKRAKVKPLPNPIIAQKRAYDREWYARNRERRCEQQREYNRRRRERLDANKAARKTRDRNAYNRAWYARNRDRLREEAAARYHAKKEQFDALAAGLTHPYVADHGT